MKTIRSGKMCVRLVTMTAALAAAAGAGADEGVVRDGLVVNYDFTAGSLPDDRGTVKDLSGNGIHATIRPGNGTLAFARTGWLDHEVYQGDGKGGRVARPAKIQALRKRDGKSTIPFGLARMDNGEVALICSWNNGESEQPVIAFSTDRGDTWSDFKTIPGARGRPMNLTFLGHGKLTFRTGKRFFSSDYGRTWAESQAVKKTANDRDFHVEGNAWVDFDEKGEAARLMEIGWHYEPGKSHPVDDATCVYRHSTDGGRTWTGEVFPEKWKFVLEHKGKKHLRGVSEGAIVRAANGWLVGALRTDMPPHYFDGPHDDSLEGTGITISKDDGKTWSGLNILFTAGRHHANLQRLPNGDLVCVMIVRDDVRGGKLASYLRGCDAVISHDNGLTWNPDRRITLDEWEFHDPKYWVNGMCGHLGSVVLDDGSILTAYGHYVKGASVLVKWRPDAGAARALPPGTTMEDARKRADARLPNVFEQVAKKGTQYSVETGPPSQLRTRGTSWIDVPLDPRIASLGPNCTIEVVLHPTNQGGMPSILRCSSIAADAPATGFWIGYDLRDISTCNQVVLSDERLDADAPADYSVVVHTDSKPKPFEPVVQQLAYVSRDGSGAFYRDGVRFSNQRAVGKAGREAIFQYCVKHVKDKSTLRLAWGAYPQKGKVQAVIDAGLVALRIYDRPLSEEELKRNRAASLGGK